MTEMIYFIIITILALGAMLGIALMSRVEKATLGNLLLAICTAGAIMIAMYWYGALDYISVWIFLAVGLVIGLWGAYRVKMIQMPQAVSMLNGFGGIASAFVGIVLLNYGDISAFTAVASGISVCIGALTLTGSVVAAGKLHGLLPQKPIIWKQHQMITIGATILMLPIIVLMPLNVLDNTLLVGLSLLLAGFFGIAFTIRVGGADMPIVISLLNSLSGLAVAAAGMASSEPLLVSVGAIIGAAGLVLTQIMCKAMNSSLVKILMGETTQKSATTAPKAESVAIEPRKEEAISKQNTPAQILAQAKSVIIVPGYGMALAQAQGLVKQLTDKLEANGVDVKYAIHPVAGRMPGHMNVLLAEVDVPYDKLYEIDDINPQFEQCDVAIVVGANDVVNPAARTAEDTSIYGMPILDVDKAANVIICNYDTKPGYAGVENPLYESDTAVMLLGDAKESLGQLLKGDGNTEEAAEAQQVSNAIEQNLGKDTAQILAGAKSAIIVPGYGMALAQAQSLVKQLADKLEANGVDVKYAIHPVAGRMPGHMNVLLAEVDVPYDKLYEIDDINPQFEQCDVAIVVGANDVVNPAARTAEDTSIYGMPILDVDKAANVIICNYDTKPGYAGVENSLYESDNVTMLMGDAKESLEQLLKGEVATSQTTSDQEVSRDSGQTAAKDPKEVLTAAKSVIIVPGYGMALAQAQSLVKQLADKLEANGADVKYAIHPVAGRMPGHMNVLLAEVDVSYDKLYEIDDINPQFEQCDVAIVVGANDVVNPAARTAEDTSIYGMPILDVDKAANVIICNYDTKPGYAGVENPLYESDNAIMLLGDAKASLEKLL